MAKYEEEKKSEAEMKKTHQATLIPEEKDEEPENGRRFSRPSTRRAGT